MKPNLALRLAAAAFVMLATVHYASAQNLLVNGGFETGSLAGWTVNNSLPPPVVNNTTPHSGTFSAFLGSAAAPEPFGDASFFQLTPILPANAMLSFWWTGFTSDTITFDWQDVYVMSPTGTILATVMHQCVTTNGYQFVSFSLAAFAGQQVRIEFLVHQDGFGDFTNMRVDDVVVTPEPSTWAMIGVGGAMLLGAMRFRRSRA